MAKPRSEQLRVVGLAQKSGLAPLTQGELDSLVAAQNKTYPKTSPDGIRMDRSVAGPMMLTYYKTVVGRSADEFEVNPANFAAYRPSFIKDACSNAGVRNLLNSGIAVRNLTRDMHGVLIYELTVRSADCAR